MSETSEVRRDDVGRDDMTGEGSAEATKADVRRGDAMGEGRRDDTAGDVRRDDAAVQGRGRGTTGGVRDAGQNRPGGQAPLTTEQIANPGAAQPAAPSPGAAQPSVPSPGAAQPPAPSPGSGQHTAKAEAAQLLNPQDREAMTRRWRDIQADFVDQPQKAMQDADALVAGLMQQLAQMFSQERSQLEAQWSRGDQVSTEDLRVSLQRYRAFFERLLSV